MKLRPAVATAATLGLVAIPLLSFPVEAGPVAVSTIAVLASDDYVDSDQEVVNLTDDLTAGGHTVVPFEDVSAAGLTAALDGADVLAIPELENSNDDRIGAASELTDEMGADAKAVIASFVDGGGRILFFGSSDPTSDINDLFGFALDGVGDFCGDGGGSRSVAPAAVGDDCVLTAAAGATEFADGPATLPYVDDSTALDPATLPSGSTVAYEGEIDTGEEPLEDVAPAAIVTIAGVAVMPYGDGAVVFLGWDWYPDAEGSEAGAADAGQEALWAEVLDLAVSQPEVTAAVNADGDIVFTSDSPSTQPVFVALTINGTTQTVTIAAQTTTATVSPSVTSATTASFAVPGWGIGEGSVQVGATAVAPPGPVPVVANPTFTG